MAAVESEVVNVADGQAGVESAAAPGEQGVATDVAAMREFCTNLIEQREDEALKAVWSRISCFTSSRELVDRAAVVQDWQQTSFVRQSLPPLVLCQSNRYLFSPGLWERLFPFCCCVLAQQT